MKGICDQIEKERTNEWDMWSNRIRKNEWMG